MKIQYFFVIFYFFSFASFGGRKGQEECLFTKTYNVLLSVIDKKSPITNEKYFKIRREDYFVGVREGLLGHSKEIITTSKKIEKLEDIYFYDPVKRKKILETLNKLDPKTKKALLSAYNKMNDYESILEYLKNLYADSLVYTREMAPKKGILPPSRGRVWYRAIPNVVIHRLKEKGDSKFVKIDKFVGSRESFGELVKEGPIIDLFFRNESMDGKFVDFGKGHGVFSHLIQRDMIHDELEKIYGNDTSEFYKFLGSPEGLLIWDELFDAQRVDRKSFSSPEHVNQLILKLL